MATKKTLPLKGVGMLKSDIRAEIESVILSTKENFICLASGRGVGKTYTVQKVVIDYCFENDYEFQLVVETNDAKEASALRKWLEKVCDMEFKTWDFKFTTEFVYARKKEGDDYKRIGVCVPLTKAIANKRNSYPKCRFIIMDEAILEDNAYKSAYMEWFLTIYHTADRDTNQIKAIFLGNTMQKINPVFEFFEITVQDLKNPGLEKRTLNKYFWYIPMPPDLENDEDNIFRKMIKGTKYGDMASGKFDEEYGYLIKEVPEGCLTYQAYGAYLGDYTCMQLLDCEDDIMYAEVVPEEHMKKYCNPIFVSTYGKATSENTLFPIWLVEEIKRRLGNGSFKFIDEEALLVLSGKFKTIFHLNVI